MVRDEEYVCIRCGDTEYLPQQPRKKHRKHKFLTMLRVPYRGDYSKLSGLKASVYIPAKSSKQDIFYYSVRCPFNGCGIIVDVNKKCMDRGAKNRTRETSSYRYLCPDNHLWYLVEENGQPSYWR